ncbi:sensor histidine kinase [Phenylobacterium sp. VNQ135]|uniref:sensor histidine kinase n=1 Tax=Phenylobacterium sp. VNQ135 TaxID=3400922 RepID=UPI003BFF122B
MLTTLILVIQPMPHAVDSAIRRLLVMLCAAFFCVGIGRVLDLGAKLNLPLKMALAFLCAVVGALFYGVVNHTAFYLIWPRWGEITWWMSFISTGFWAIWVFLAWTAVHFALGYEDQLKEKSLRLQRAQTLAARAQNQMLRYQINPHFLFNTLNALSALILARETDRAEKVVLMLSGFLRYTLEKELPEKVPLHEELGAQRQYLSIEQVRFEDRLQFRADVPDAVRDALAPWLILQPLVENAVKYGVARSIRPVTIEIRAWEQEGRLCVAVCDDGDNSAQEAPPKLGLGLENVRSRLDAMYGRDADLVCGPRADRGWECRLELPLERAA